MITITIDGIERVISNVTEIGSLDFVKPALLAAGVHIQGKINRYPPSSEANTPDQRRWYERGYGPKWKRKDGTVGGKKTSETLGRKWAVATENDGMTVIIGNNVTYAPYVQDEDHQARFHAARGWKTAQTVIEEEGDTVIQFILSELHKVTG